MSFYKKLTQGLISGIQDTDKLGFAGAMGIGPWAVPLAPAIIFGWALYESAPKDMDSNLRIIAGAAAALGLVIAGAVSSHNAISLQISGIEGKNLWFAWFLVFSYIGLEISGLWFMGIDTQIKVVGTVVSLLTLIVYLSRSAMSRLSEAKQDRVQAKQLQRDDELAEKAHQRELERLRLQMEQDQRLAEIEAQNKKDLEKIQADKEKNIAKLSVPKSVPNGVSGVSQIGTNLSQKAQKKAILDNLETSSDTNMTQLAEQLGIGRSTLYRRIDELKAEGKITINESGYIVTNGNGSING